MMHIEHKKTIEEEIIESVDGKVQQAYGPTAIEFLVREKQRYERKLADLQEQLRVSTLFCKQLNDADKIIRQMSDNLYSNPSHLKTLVDKYHEEWYQ